MHYQKLHYQQVLLSHETVLVTEQNTSEKILILNSTGKNTID